MNKFLFQKRADAIVKKLDEALFIGDDDKLDFNYKGPEGLKVTLGKGKGITFEPFESNSKDFGGSKVISMFSTSNIKGMDREEIVTPILKALKGQSATEVPKDDFKRWLAQAGRVMGKHIAKTYKPDAVLAVKSSSQLNNLFTKEVANHLPGVAMIPDAISKADISKITASPKASEKQKKDIERILKKAKATGVLSMKNVHVSLRPFFKGVMQVEDVAKNIEGKTIIMIDDIMTTRATQMHAIDVIKQYNPKEVIGVTLFKN